MKEHPKNPTDFGRYFQAWMEENAFVSVKKKELLALIDKCKKMEKEKAENENLKSVIWSKGDVCEDELPDFIDDDVFDLLFKTSKIDIIRVYPKLIVEALCGKKYLKGCE